MKRGNGRPLQCHGVVRFLGPHFFSWLFGYFIGTGVFFLFCCLFIGWVFGNMEKRERERQKALRQPCRANLKEISTRAERYRYQRTWLKGQLRGTYLAIGALGK